MLLLPLAVLLATPAFGDDVDTARVLPTRPGVADELSVVLEGTWPLDCPPVFRRAVEVDGNDVSILVSAAPQDPPPTNCAVADTPYRATYRIPALGEPGLYDVEIVWVDTPFLPTMIAQASFEVFPGGDLFLELSPATESHPGSALIYGLWPRGCVPALSGVRRITGSRRLELVTEVVREQCSGEAEPFALHADLPWLQEEFGYDLKFLVEERQSTADSVTDVFQRASRSFDVGPAEMTPRVQQGRFQVTVNFLADFRTRLAKLAPGSSADTALFYFFNADNIEVQVKVLDGCALNDRFWVFTAASTDLAYTIRVEDLATNETRVYENAGGNPAVAVNDTDAFATCNP